MSLRTLTIPLRLITGPAPGGGAVSLSTPSAVGDSGAAAYSENAIARWDVVPYQTIGSTLKVGVVAFHAEGIARVDFLVDGGAPRSASSMTSNADTGVTEYWVTLTAADYTDGPHTVQAIAYPVSGVPRVLPDLVFNSNHGTTLPTAIQYLAATGGSDSNDGLTAGAPKATLDAALAAGRTALGGNLSGLTIYLLAGTYTFASSGQFARYTEAMTRWTTITPAPGVAKSAVIINGMTGSDGIVQQLLKFSGVTVHAPVLGAPSGFVASRMWWHDCAFVGTGTNAWDVDLGDQQASFKYYTAPTFTHCKNGPDGAEIVRDAVVTDIAEGGFRNCNVVINSSVDGIDPGIAQHTPDTYLHPDGLQITDSRENVVWYGVTLSNINTVVARIQESGRDIAMVNIVGDSGTSIYVMEIERRYQHMLIKGGSWTSGAFVYDGSVGTTNVVFDGVTMTTPPGARAGVTIR